MGKRGRPPNNIRKYAVPTNMDPNRVLMKPEEVGRLSAKNSRTIVKIMQLLEVKNSVPGDAEKKGVLKDKIEKLKVRLNRRLKKCANWSDERLSNRMPLPEKRRKMEASYKNPTETPKWVSVPRLPTEEDEHPTNTLICTGSQNSYTEEYNSQLLEKGEITTRVPLSRLQQRRTVLGGDSVLFKGHVDNWKFLTDDEMKNLEVNNPEELKRRRRLDTDHRYYMKKKAEGRF